MTRALTLVALGGLVLHGLIHLMGTAVYLRWATLAGLPYKTSLLGGRWELGEGGMRVFGVLWALAAGGFLAAALGWWAGLENWTAWLLAVTLVSLVLTALDAGVAYMGAVVNLVILAALAVGTAYRSDMDAAYERIQGRSHVVSSPYGAIEYAERGSGPAVLVVHGAGGGFDQGEMIAEAVLDERFRWIAPSRFGYLGSTFNPGSPAEDQAHAYAWLLDHLGIERAAVVAMSAGGPSALDFALLHPERLTSLTLLSCATTSPAVAGQTQSERKGDTLRLVFGSDFFYWSAVRLFQRRFMELMGADEAVIADLSPSQKDWIERLIERMNPVSPRHAGVVLDNTRPGPGDRIAGVRVPTLVIHAEDDTLQVFEHATFAAATIPGAKLVRFARGGHFVVIVEQAAVRAAVQRHILDHASESGIKTST